MKILTLLTPPQKKKKKKKNTHKQEIRNFGKFVFQKVLINNHNQTTSICYREPSLLMLKDLLMLTVKMSIFNTLTQILLPGPNVHRAALKTTTKVAKHNNIMLTIIRSQVQFATGILRDKFFLLQQL